MTILPGTILKSSIEWKRAVPQFTTFLIVILPSLVIASLGVKLENITMSLKLIEVVVPEFHAFLVVILTTSITTACVGLGE